MTVLSALSAVEQAQLIRSREISPVDLVRHYLERIERYNPRLGAFVTVAADQAVAAARRAERATPNAVLPKFHGVPISVKDLCETAGIRTTWSSRAFANHVPKRDSLVVSRLKQAGFIILGKTNTSEFGSLPITESILNGSCRNPWQVQLSPGGSSGGAAVAVAARLSPVSQGRDGAGSVRIPAACCGVVGIKPTGGGGAVDGAMARTVSDAAALLDVLTADPKFHLLERSGFSAPRENPARLRIAYTCESPLNTPVDSDYAAAVVEAAHLLSILGHEVESAAPDWQDAQLLTHFLVMRRKLLLEQGAAADEMDDFNAALMRLDSADTEALIAEALMAETALQAVAQRILAFWQTYDLLLTPTLAQPPGQTGWLLQSPQSPDPRAIFTRAAQFAPFPAAANLTGQPALSMPFRFGSRLPVSIQLFGRPGGEAELIQVASQIEENCVWKPEQPAEFE